MTIINVRSNENEIECTEVYLPMIPTNEIIDFEIPQYQTNDDRVYFGYCYERWGAQPRPNWEEMYFFNGK